MSSDRIAFAKIQIHRTTHPDFKSLGHSSSFCASPDHKLVFKLGPEITKGENGVIRFGQGEDPKDKIVVKEFFLKPKSPEEVKNAEKWIQKIKQNVILGAGDGEVQFVEGTYYSFMPYLGDQTLAAYVKSITDFRVLLDLGIKTMDAAIALHEQKISHNDLHANNFLVSVKKGKSIVKICDFDECSPFGKKLKKMGPWHSLAPELREGPVSHPIQDTFSIGFLFYETTALGFRFKYTPKVIEKNIRAISSAMTEFDPNLRLTLSDAKQQLADLEKYADLLLACDKKDSKEIENMLSHHPELDINVALTLAIRGQCPTESIAILLEQKPDLNFQYHGENLFLAALQTQSDPIIQLILAEYNKEKGRLKKILQQNYLSTMKLPEYKKIILFSKWLKPVTTLTTYFLQYHSFDQLEEWFLEFIQKNQKDFVLLKHMAANLSDLILEYPTIQDFFENWLRECTFNQDKQALYFFGKCCPPAPIFVGYSQELVRLLAQAGNIKDYKYFIEKLEVPVPGDIVERFAHGIISLISQLSHHQINLLVISRIFDEFPNMLTFIEEDSYLYDTITSNLQSHIESAIISKDDKFLKAIKSNIPKKLFSEVLSMDFEPPKKYRSPLAFALSTKDPKIIGLLTQDEKKVDTLFLNKSFAKGNYEPIKIFNTLNPGHITESLYVLVAGCIYYGNLDELKNIAITFPQEFKKCLEVTLFTFFYATFLKIKYFMIFTKSDKRLFPMINLAEKGEIFMFCSMNFHATKFQWCFSLFSRTFTFRNNLTTFHDIASFNLFSRQ